jgi:DNA polymerase-3 subunit epsilon
VRAATAGRTILAYNSEFDRRRLVFECERHGVDGADVVDASRWACVMNRRSDHARSWRSLPLGGGHRALGDAQRAREVLLGMTGRPTR